jgi:hypothetical protein
LCNFSTSLPGYAWSMIERRFLAWLSYTCFAKIIYAVPSHSATASPAVSYL